MPRPKFSPTDDQRITIRTLAALARRRAKLAAIDEEIDRAIERASDQEIPVAVIADTLGWQRKTVYRHLGRPM